MTKQLTVEQYALARTNNIEPFPNYYLICKPDPSETTENGIIKGKLVLEQEEKEGGWDFYSVSSTDEVPAGSIKMLIPVPGNLNFVPVFEVKCPIKGWIYALVHQGQIAASYLK